MNRKIELSVSILWDGCVCNDALRENKSLTHFVVAVVLVAAMMEVAVTLAVVVVSVRMIPSLQIV